MAGSNLALVRRGSGETRELWLRVLAASSADLVLVVDAAGVISFGGPGAVRILRTWPEQLEGTRLAQHCHPDDRQTLDQALLIWSHAGSDPHVAEFRVANDSGDWVKLEASAVDLTGHDLVRGIVITARDTSARSVDLNESQARLVRAARGANDGLWDWDLITGDVHYNERWKSMVGLDQLEPLAEEWFDRIHPEDRQHFEALLTAHLDGHTDSLESDHRVLHVDGSYRWMLCRGLAIRDKTGKAVRLAGSLMDISERKLFDALTGLPNRSTFRDTLQRTVERSSEPEGSQLFAVLVLDLDRFKVVNDSLGHGTGDRLLISVARRLETCVRSRDTVARLGGDEFAILLDGLDTPEDAERIANHIQKLLAGPIYVGSTEVYTTASVGIALSTKGYDRAGDILRDADTAMHRAKRSGRDRSETFQTLMHVETLNHFQMEVDLRRALRREEFRVRYQPLVDFRTGKLCGFEALCRWEHPERGFVSPMDFIPLAEEVGLIAPIDRWVLQEATNQARAWQDHLPAGRDLVICVNVSSKQFSRDDLADHVAGVLEACDLRPEFLKLEITESAIMENPERASEILRDLKAMGVKLALDDFGTGYSSLGHLHRFPFDTIKIDRSFVSQMGVETWSSSTSSGADRDRNPELVRTIVNLAQSLEMDVVAEGVETALQIDLLRDLECTYGQGYHFAKPLTPEDAESMLRADPTW